MTVFILRELVSPPSGWEGKVFRDIFSVHRTLEAAKAAAEIDFHFEEGVEWEGDEVPGASVYSRKAHGDSYATIEEWVISDEPNT